MMKVYISGKITGDPDHKRKFDEAEEKLREMGHVVLNPTILPDGLEYDNYMDIDMAMVRACDVVALLPDWEESAGARAEMAYGECLGKLSSPIHLLA
jgi:hypothetical protein